MSYGPTLPSFFTSSVAHGLIDSPTAAVVGGVKRTTQHDDERPRPKEEPDEAPETPPDELKAVPGQDPPPEPDQAPYVVRGLAPGRSSRKSRAMNEGTRGRMNGQRKERRGFASMSAEK